MVGTVNVQVTAAAGAGSAGRAKVVLKMGKTRLTDEEYILGEAAVPPGGEPAVFANISIGDFIAELYAADGTRVYNEKHSLVTQ